MRTLGSRSLATFLRVALRIAQIVLYASAVLSAFGAAAMLFYAYGMEITWFDQPRPAPAMAWLFVAIITAFFVATIIIVGRLRRIFVTLSEGDPFVPENALHLRVIWVTLAVWELLRYALGGATMAVMAVLQIEPPDGMERSPVDVSLSVWFAVLTLIVLAEVFREGSRMRQEQQFTI